MRQLDYEVDAKCTYCTIQFTCNSQQVEVSIASYPDQILICNDADCQYNHKELKNLEDILAA